MLLVLVLFIMYFTLSSSFHLHLPMSCVRFTILLNCIITNLLLLDELISELLSSLKEKDENILAIYTAHHASWVRFFF